MKTARKNGHSAGTHFQEARIPHSWSAKTRLTVEVVREAGNLFCTQCQEGSSLHDTGTHRTQTIMLVKKGLGLIEKDNCLPDLFTSHLANLGLVCSWFPCGIDTASVCFGQDAHFRSDFEQDPAIPWEPGAEPECGGGAHLHDGGQEGVVAAAHHHGVPGASAAVESTKDWSLSFESSVSYFRR